MSPPLAGGYGNAGVKTSNLRRPLSMSFDRPCNASTSCGSEGPAGDPGKDGAPLDGSIVAEELSLRELRLPSKVADFLWGDRDLQPRPASRPRMLGSLPGDPMTHALNRLVCRCLRLKRQLVARLRESPHGVAYIVKDAERRP